MVRPQPSEPRPRQPANIPLHRHEFLRFQYQDEENEVASILQKRFLDIYYIDWDVFQTLGIGEEIEGYFSDPWRNLLTIQDPQYVEPTVQFLMTFSFNASATSIHSKAVFFMLGTQRWELSFMEFGTALGIFAGPSITVLGEYPEVPDPELFEFWRTISSTPFETSSTKATALDDPRIHILHRILAYTIFSRKETANNVNLFDLQILRPLILGIPICPAMALLRGLQRFSGMRTRTGSPIAGGQYITRLGRHLQAWTPDQEWRFTREGMIRPLSLDSLRQAKMVKKVQGVYRLCQGPNHNIWDRPEAEETEEAVTESPRAAGRRRRRRRVVAEDEEEAEETQAGGSEPMQTGYEEPPQVPRQSRYDMPQGWRFPDPGHYDPYVAYHHTGEGISSVGWGVDHLATQFETFSIDYRRDRERSSRRGRASDQRIHNMSQGMAGLQRYGEEFREYRAESSTFQDDVRRGLQDIQRRQEDDYERLQSTMTAFRAEHTQLRQAFYRFTDDYYNVSQDDDDEDDDE